MSIYLKKYMDLCRGCKNLSLFLHSWRFFFLEMTGCRRKSFIFSSLNLREDSQAGIFTGKPSFFTVFILQ